MFWLGYYCHSPDGTKQYRVKHRNHLTTRRRSEASWGVNMSPLGTTRSGPYLYATSSRLCDREGEQQPLSLLLMDLPSSAKLGSLAPRLSSSSPSPRLHL
ncbi:hypothetical protein XPA_001786 [Xanthoria parietina]